jgi:perosamine synthetase
MVTKSASFSVNSLLKLLNESGYQSRPIWEPMHLLPMYRTCPRSTMDMTDTLRNGFINLPSSADLVMGCPVTPS